MDFCLLAHNYDPAKFAIAGWWMSEKLDGMRAIWLPNTRGLSISSVDFANRERDKRNYVCTGLWSRLRKPIMAPDWWLDKLPTSICLDGELYLGRGRFQEIISICRSLDSGIRWQGVEYWIFDSPRLLPGFEYTQNKMISLSLENDVVHLLLQTKLPSSTNEAISQLEETLFNVSASGGEGLMLRKPGSIWLPRRTYDLLKVKKFSDGLGVVIGYTSGLGKLSGLMGNLILLVNGEHRLEISGFTDWERDFQNLDSRNWAIDHPGKVLPSHLTHTRFPIGSLARFKYNQLTTNGIPKIARYFR